MSRKGLFVTLCALAFVAAGGIAQTIGLVNGTEGQIYVGTIPVDERAYLSYQQNPLQLKTLILQEFPSMIGVAPASFAQNLSGHRNDSLIFGFALQPGREGAPIFMLRVPPATGQHAYLITEEDFVPGLGSDQAYLSFSSFELPRSGEFIVVDRRFVDWLQVPDLRRYPSGFRPSQVIQRASGSSPGGRAGELEETKELELVDSLFWEKSGVKIERLKAVLGQEKLFIMVSAFQNILPGSRYILRFYPQADQMNVGSLEIPVRGIGGPVYLWPRGSDTPVIVGQYSAANFSLEAEFDLPALSRFFGLDAGTFESSYWELSSALAEAGVLEEFVYGAIPSSEFVRLGR